MMTFYKLPPTSLPSSVPPRLHKLGFVGEWSTDLLLFSNKAGIDVGFVKISALGNPMTVAIKSEYAYKFKREFREAIEDTEAR